MRKKSPIANSRPAHSSRPPITVKTAKPGPPGVARLRERPFLDVEKLAPDDHLPALLDHARLRIVEVDRLQ